MLPRSDNRLGPEGFAGNRSTDRNGIIPRTGEKVKPAMGRRVIDGY